MAQFAMLRAASRFWTAWWYVIFAVISAPLWIAFFIIFLRRFVHAGYRLVATGYFLVVMGALGVMGSLAYCLGLNSIATPFQALLNSAIAVLTLFAGIALTRRRGRED